MKYYIFIYLLIFFFTNTLRSQQIHKAKFKEILSIGDNEVAEKEYLFNDPSFICVDKAHRIFISESSEMAVRVFDSTGNYIKNIGRHGRGPGEFLNFTLMYINNNDELLIFDNFSARISIFKTSGKFEKQIIYDFNKLLWPRTINQFKDGNYLLGYKLPNIDGDFYEFDSSLQKIIAKSYSNIFSRYDAKIDEIMTMAFKNSVAILDDNTFICAKHFYDGKLSIVVKRKNFWVLKKKVNGFVFNNVGYERISGNEKDRNSKGKPRFELITHYNGEKILAKVFNVSKALFVLKDKRIIHFTTVTKKREKYFGFELFNQNLNLINYYEIYKKDVLLEQATTYPLEVLWKDENDNFYIVDYSKFPTVKKIKIFFN